MEFLKILENMPFITSFKRKLLKKDYKNSTEIARDVAKLFYETIQTSIQDKNITSQAELILVVTYLGKIFTSIDPVQFCTGNTIKRILHIIKEEINKVSEDDKINEDKKQEILSENIKEAKEKFKNLRNFTFGEIEEEKSTRKNSEVEKKTEEENEDNEQNSSQKLFELQKLKSPNLLSEDNKNNILKRIEDLILEIDSISDSIKEQKEVKDLICDGDVILTSHYSEQVADILIENAKTKKFKVFIVESAPLFHGRIQAENLSKKGIDTAIIGDDDIYSFMSTMLKVKVFLGARAILVNGGLITYGGAYNICLSAKMLPFHIPVIIVGGTTKLTPMHSFKHELYNEYLSPDLIFGKKVKYKGDISNIQFNNPAFDYVPPDLITIYATNYGIINPNCLYRSFSDLYDQEDYEI
jgi:translation initiation factor eIF-2B subunit beta